MGKNRLAKYEPFWDKWFIEEWIGEGDLANVYKIKKEELGVTSYAALKVISIPKVQTENRRNNSNQNTLNGFFKQIIDTIEPEIKALMCLKGKSNILAYEDYLIIERENEVGYDILLRMELKTNVIEAFSEKEITNNKEIIKMGRDLCWGLYEAHKEKIYHMDIKLENIFVSQYGDYFLGDFALAKKIESFQPNLFKNNSKVFTAPEILRKREYGEHADIYAIGVLLHILLNDGVILSAFEDRTRNSKIEKPVRASDRIYAIIKKAIAFDAEERYATAEEFFYTLSEIKGDDFALPKEYLNRDDSEIKDSKNVAEEVSEKKQEETSDETIENSRDKTKEPNNFLDNIINQNVEDSVDNIVKMQKEEETSSIPKKDKEHSINEEEDVNIQSNEDGVSSFDGEKEEENIVEAFLAGNENQEDNAFWNDGNKEEADKKKSKLPFVIIGIIVLMVILFFLFSHGLTNNQNRADNTVVTMEAKKNNVSNDITASENNIPSNVTSDAIQETQKPNNSTIPSESSVPVANVSSEVIVASQITSTPSITSTPEPEQTPEASAVPTATPEPLKIDKEKENITKITEIKNYKKATELIISQNKLKNLKGIEAAIYLRILDAGFNQIIDISNLSTLNTMEVLYLEANQIKDISALADLTNLQELSLSENEISDISSLESLSELKVLKLNENKIEDITALGNLQKLEHLDLSGNPEIDDITSLKKLVNLKFLSISGTSITNKQQRELRKVLPEDCMIY